MESANDNRRKFLKLLLAGGAMAVATPIASGQEAGAATDKVKMLTDDGTLVEIDRKLLERIRTGEKASSEEIRNFIQPSSK